MNPNSKIWIAGHTGMVGSALVRALSGAGYRNLLVVPESELDLTRQSRVEKFLDRERPALIFLAAARVGGILANSTRPAEFLYDNLAIAANVINAAYESGVEKLVNFGSSCIYPRQAAQPLREDYLLTGPLEPTNEAYAVAKISAIKLCRYYHEQFGCDYISLMPTNLYGPNDNYDLQSSHVLPALIRKFHLARCLATNDRRALERDLEVRPLPIGTPTFDLTRRSRQTKPEEGGTSSLPELPGLSNLGLPGGLPSAVHGPSPYGISADTVTLWGTGSPRREFLHVDDVAAAALHLAEKCSADDVGEFVNVGCGVDLSIAELAELVRNVVGYEGEIRWDPDKPDGTPRKLLDISRIRALGWSPSISLEEGVRMTYRDYLSSIK